MKAPKDILLETPPGKKKSRNGIEHTPEPAIEESDKARAKADAKLNTGLAECIALVKKGSKKVIEGTFDVAKGIYDASELFKASMTRTSEFQGWAFENFQMDKTAASKYCTIGGHPFLTDRKRVINGEELGTCDWAMLPNSASTIYLIAALYSDDLTPEDNRFNFELVMTRINPGMTRTDVENVIKNTSGLIVDPWEEEQRKSRADRKAEQDRIQAANEQAALEAERQRPNASPLGTGAPQLEIVHDEPADHELYIVHSDEPTKQQIMEAEENLFVEDNNEVLLNDISEMEEFNNALKAVQIANWVKSLLHGKGIRDLKVTMTIERATKTSEANG